MGGLEASRVLWRFNRRSTSPAVLWMVMGWRFVGRFIFVRLAPRSGVVGDDGLEDGVSEPCRVVLGLLAAVWAVMGWRVSVPLAKPAWCCERWAGGRVRARAGGLEERCGFQIASRTAMGWRSIR